MPAHNVCSSCKPVVAGLVNLEKTCKEPDWRPSNLLLEMLQMQLRKFCKMLNNRRCNVLSMYESNARLSMKATCQVKQHVCCKLSQERFLIADLDKALSALGGSCLVYGPLTPDYGCIPEYLA